MCRSMSVCSVPCRRFWCDLFAAERRLIAYSSTLIGIIFSLILRVVLLFPYRQKLLGCDNNSEAGK